VLKPEPRNFDSIRTGYPGGEWYGEAIRSQGGQASAPLQLTRRGKA
jgi:hypothetical protein